MTLSQSTADCLESYYILLQSVVSCCKYFSVSWNEDGFTSFTFILKEEPDGSSKRRTWITKTDFQCYELEGLTLKLEEILKALRSYSPESVAIRLA